MSDKVEIIVTATDEASKTLREIGNVAGGLGNVLGGALKIGLAGAVVGFTALAAGTAASIKEAMDAEGTMAQLDAVLRSTGAAAANSVAQVPQATKEAASAIKDATTAHADGVREATESAAEAAQALTERAIALAERHKDRIDDINASIRDANTDFAENQQERHERLQERIGDIEERAGEQRESLLERLGEATTQKEKDKINKQLAELDAKTARQIEKAQAAAQKEEARAQKEHDKRITALQKQIDRENKEYERQTAAIQKEREKQAKDAREHLAKVEAAYKKAMDAITEKFTAVERGVAVPMKKVEQASKEMILATADALSKSTAYTDDAILAGQTVLLQFGNIGKDVLPQTTEMVLNLATRLGISIPAAAQLLGKAMSGGGEGLMKLRAAGLNVTDAFEKQYKQMIANGDQEGAQLLLLAELEKSVGGTAKAYGQTFAGQLQIAQNQIGNVGEEIGGAFLPTLKELTGWVNKEIIPAFKAWAEENAPKIQAALKQLGDWIKIEGIPALTTLKTWIDENIPPIVAAITDAWNNELKPALESLKAWLKTDGVAALKIFFQNMEEFKPLVEEWKTLMSDLKNFTAQMTGGIKNDSGNDFLSFANIVSGVMDELKKTIREGFAIIHDVQLLFQSLMKGDMVGFLDNLVMLFVDVWKTTLPGKMMTLADDLGKLLSTKLHEVAGDSIRGLINGFWDQADAIRRALNEIVQGAINEIKKRLGIHSPSQVFAEMGVNMARGLMEGFAQPQLNFAPVMMNAAREMPSALATNAPTAARGNAPTFQGGITVIFQLATAPRTQEEGNQAAQMLVNGLRAQGVPV